MQSAAQRQGGADGRTLFFSRLYHPENDYFRACLVLVSFLLFQTITGIVYVVVGLAMPFGSTRACAALRQVRQEEGGTVSLNLLFGAAPVSGLRDLRRYALHGYVLSSP